MSADIIDFPGTNLEERSMVIEMSTRFPQSTIDLQEDEIDGYDNDTVAVAGETYGQLAIDDFEGSHEAAIASLERAIAFVRGRSLIARANRILGPRSSTTGPEAA